MRRRGGLRFSILGVTAVVLCGMLGSSSGTAAPNVPGAATGYIHRQDTAIVDGNGNPIRLRGPNLGNWLVWEGWMMGARTLKSATQSKIESNLASLVGQAREQQFVSDVQANYITLADFKQIAALGFNAVRVPFGDSLLEDPDHPYVYKDSGWQLLDNLMSWAQQTGIYVVLDLHAAPGGQSTSFVADPDPTGANLWHSAEDQARTVALWQAVAARYSTNPWIAMYDLLNEPAAPTNTALTSLYQRIIAAIRSVDPNHMILLEGAASSTRNGMFTYRYDDNLALSFHQYLWTTLNPEGQIVRAEADATRLDVPLWVGEMGTDSYANIAGRVQRFDGDPMVSGWSFWSYKGSTNPTGVRWLVPFVPTASWLTTINWLNNQSRPQPSPAVAEQGLQDYIRIVSSQVTDSKTVAALTG